MNTFEDRKKETGSPEEPESLMKEEGEIMDESAEMAAGGNDTDVPRDCPPTRPPKLGMYVPD